MKHIAKATVLITILSMAGCETLDKLGWTTVMSTGIGCAAGLGLGAIYDETQRKKSNKDRKKDVFAIFKKKKAQNNGKMVGLATGCLAGLGTGMYLDLMHDDMEEQLGSRGVKLEKVKGPDGETDELLVKMDGDISFDTGSSTLRGVARSNVDTLTEAMEKYPETKVKVWGHTDGTGSRAINDRLSLQRAQTVANELDLSSSRVGEVRGWANERPLPGTNKSGAVTANRRVEVFIQPNE